MSKKIIYNCDICGKEVPGPELLTVKIPVWENGDASADYYRDESLRKPHIFFREFDACKECLIKVTMIQEHGELNKKSTYSINQAPENSSLN